MPDVHKKRSVFGQIIVFLLLVITLISLSFLAYLKSQGYEITNLSIQDLKAFYFATTSKVDKGVLQNEIEYLQSDHPVFTVYKDYIVKITADSIKYYSKDGEEVFNKSLTLKNPIVRSNDKELLLADTGSREVYVLKDKEVKWNYKIEGSIINAEIDATGHVAVVHEIKGYKSAVTVFNLQGGPFFTRNIAEGIAIKANISPKAQFVTTTMLDTSGIDSMSQLEVTNILGSPVGEKVTGIDDLISNIQYLDNELAVGVGSKIIIGIDSKNKEKWRTSSDDYRISYSARLDGKNILAVAISDEKSLLTSDLSSKVLKISNDGKVTEVYKHEGYIKNINAKDGVISMNLGKEVVFISSAGKKLGNYSPKMDVNEVNILSSNEAAIITKSAVEIIKIN